jgi:hypothetical protein
MSDQIIIRGNIQAQEFKQAPVKPTIIIGLGGSGGDIMLRVRKRFFEKYGSLSQFPLVSYLWIDTDATEKDVGAGVFAEQIAFAPNEKIMAVMADTTKVTNDLNQYPHIKKWFYPGLSKLKTMTEGAGQIRAYSRLGFYDHYVEIRNAIINAGAQVRNVENIRTVREKHNLEATPSELQVFVLFSLAGGTGSGMFLDLSFLVKDIFRGQALTTIGCVMMPGLFNPHEDRVFANSYAAVKELEHYSYENDFQVEWPDGVNRTIPGPPFNYTYLIDRTNYANNAVDFSTREIIFNMVAENIFKDFTQSDFAGYKRGVRVNLDQYLVDLFAFRHLNESRESIIDQKFITRFSSFGMAAITVPADRIEQACAYKLAADVVDHWGSLSNTDFNAAILTDVVLSEVLPDIQMYEGNFSAQGMIEQRRDIQNQLLDDGRGQGQKIHNLINEAIGQTVREVQENVHRQKGHGLAQYLRAAVEREQAKLDNRKSNPQQWGDYARAIHFNRETIIEHSQTKLRQVIGRIINEQHQSVGYAIALMRQIVNVLRDEHREYIPNFERTRAQDIKRSEEASRELNHLFSEIARHETRSNWDGRKSVILSYDVKRFEEMAPVYLNAILLSQVRGAAKEACDHLIEQIGLAERTESGEVMTEGLIGELYKLGGQLENLKRKLVTNYDEFKKATPNDLSLLLYDPSDIENNYLPRYIGTGERASKAIESIGDQILQELHTSVIDLPRVVREKGIDKVEAQIRDLARKPFQNIKKDFDVIETFWKKYPNENEREAQVRFIYNKAKFWLKGGSRPRSYVLSSERHKLIVGVPGDCTDPIKLNDFRKMLGKIPTSGDAALSIQNLPDRSEIVFYSEVGGIPINWSDAVPELRQKYLQKQGDGEELHTDCNEIKFNDLVVLDDHERKELEEAYECFLLGVIFGEIKPEKDGKENVRYYWSQRVGLAVPERKMALGIEMRAMAELISKPQIRKDLLERSHQHINSVRRDRDALARFNALLGWYFEEIYPETKISDSDGAEHTEQSNACRAVVKQINQVEADVRTQNGKAREFITLSQKYRKNLDKIAPKLDDGKRMLILKATQQETFKIGG